jgi:pimeloyl-ACP methyl ester carboxylesterase
LDYDGSDGGAISIALVRLPASDPAHRIGSLFLNPGGPGGSGVDFTLFASPFLYTDEVRARFDLVGFDPRGIARSTALRCFGNPKQWGPYLTLFAFPSTPAEEQAWMNADLFLVASCAQRGGRIADHMSTANVARDLDLLRRAVGDAKLTYAGYSYGTMIGQTYANMFPGNVRAIIIDGVLDPIAWTTGSGDGSTVPFSTRVHSDIGAQMTLLEFFRLCDARRTELCVRTGLGGSVRCAREPAQEPSRLRDVSGWIDV